MNLYFWLFLLYAVLITPVGVRVHVCVDQGIHYRIRIQAAGLPFIYGGKADQGQSEGQIQADRMKNWDLALFVQLLRERHIQRALRSLEWRKVELTAHVSFGNAALTAIFYAALQTTMLTIRRCTGLPVCDKITADFEGKGTQIAFACIVGARLGRITAAAIRLWLAANGARAKRLIAEEENYAAAPH